MQDAARAARQVDQRRGGLGHGAGARAPTCVFSTRSVPHLPDQRGKSRGLGHARRAHFLLDNARTGS